MTTEEKQNALSGIEADQKKLLDEIIRISKKIEKKSVKSSIESAIQMVGLGLQIRMLEAQKMVIMSQPVPKEAKEDDSHSSGPAIVGEGSNMDILVRLMDGNRYNVSPKPINIEEIKRMTDRFEMDILIEKSRYGGLHPNVESDLRSAFNAKIEALELSISSGHR